MRHFVQSVLVPIAVPESDNLFASGESGKGIMAAGLLVVDVGGGDRPRGGTILMDNDREVTAVFKCGGLASPLLIATLGALALFAVQGLVDVRLGLALAAGTLAGSIEA